MSDRLRLAFGCFIDSAVLCLAAECRLGFNPAVRSRYFADGATACPLLGCRVLVPVANGLPCVRVIPVTLLRTYALLFQ